MGKLERRNVGSKKSGVDTVSVRKRIPKKDMGVGKARKVKKSYKEICDALAKCNGMVSFAAKRLGTSWNTLNKYIKENPKLEDYIASLTEKRVDYAESILDRLVAKEDKTAVIFFLKTKGKKRGYIEDEKVDMSKLCQPITFIYQPPPKQE